MDFNLHPSRRTRAASLATLLAAFCLTPGALRAQAPCPPESNQAVEHGWRAYRADSIEAAGDRFRAAERLCPQNLDAKVGLGFTFLRLNQAGQADSVLRLVVMRDSTYTDAWEGLARAALRRGDLGTTAAAGRRAMTLAPTNDELRQLLDRVVPDWNRSAAPVRRPDSLQLFARARGDRFEVRSGAGWRPFYAQGVNLGVALPGRFPAEFPEDSAVYAGWLAKIAEMRANVVRVYTILPPTFYRALRGWNTRHPEHALYLIHGVWTELPPEHNFDDPAWTAAFRSEMRRVVDVVHGATELPPHPGHARGRYDADVSRWTLAYIIGREWEPYAARAYADAHPGTRAYQGRYLEMPRGTVLDGWMAAQCDFMLGYEAERYNALRPIAYTNWPTLDPLHHPTESTADEERRLRPAPHKLPPPRAEHLEEDLVSLDATLVRPTAANPAGWFASYHAYPYYPDFMNLDPGYSRARSSMGRSNYFGYLTELKRHHAGMPLLIAEYGVPSSRGVAHLQPQGWHHGGHDEREMAAIDARLTREIRESGAAGAVIFAWMDEWFKHNWAVMDFEVPLEHTPRWHNVMDAEQNYGILGHYAGDGTGPVLGGDPERWLALEMVGQAPTVGQSSKVRQSALPASSTRPATPRGRLPAPDGIRLGADESYLYVAIPFDGPLSWDSLDVQIALDTYRPDRGQRALPGGAVTSEIGFEFLVDLRAPDDAELRITPDYNPYAPASSIERGDDYARFYHHPAASVARADGRFDSLFIITNRARYSRDGTFFPAQGYNRGRLRYGRQEESSLADWYYDETAGLLELRLPWGLLNVTDPSTRTVLDERADALFATAETDGVRVGVVVRSAASAGGRVVGALPAVKHGGRWAAGAFPTWRWPTWTEPKSHSRLKPVYDSLKAVWEETW